MRLFRFTIASLMGIVLLVALGAAALRYPSETTAAIVSMVTTGALSLALVGAVCRTGTARTWWLGFAALGWTYVGLPFRSLNSSQLLSSMIVLNLIAPSMGVPIADRMPFRPGAERAFFLIGHNLLALIAAAAGGFLAMAIFAAARERSLETTASTPPGGRTSRKWWTLAVMLLLSAVLLSASTAVTYARIDPRISAGSMYVLTWCLIGLTALGALWARGRRREFCMGAAVLGAGFMVLVFNRPNDFECDDPRLFLPTVQFVEALRPRFVALVSVFSVGPKSGLATEVLTDKALNTRVPINFPAGTKLREIIEYVRYETSGPNGEIVPIYTDPIGLAEADKTMESEMRGAELQGVPLRATLRLCLGQFDLGYIVRDGVVVITSLDGLDVRQDLTISPHTDPFQMIGHCLLALIAAVLGGLAAPFLCDLARGPRGAEPVR